MLNRNWIALTAVFLALGINALMANVELVKPTFITSYRGHYEKHIAPQLHQLDWQNHELVAKKLVDKDEVFPKTIELIESAKKQIFFGSYLFGGKIGDDILAALKKKQDQGVNVFLVLSKTSQSYDKAKLKEQEIFDELHEAEKAGNPVIKPPYMQKMSKAKAMGIPTVHAETKFIDAWVPVRVDHSKILVIDGVEAIFGGMNYADTTSKNHDTMVHVAGPFVQELEKNFANNWICGWAKEHPRLLYTEEAALAKMNELSKDPSYKKSTSRLTVTAPFARNTREELIRLFDEAKHSILVENLLFNDTKVLKAVARAAKRGVKIRLLLDPAEHLYYRDWRGGPNNKAVAVIQKIQEKHPELDVEARFYKVGPGAELHMKICIVDDKTLGIGSTNFTSGAFQSNYEMFAFMEGGIVEEYLDLFWNDWKNHSKEAPKVNLGRKIISIISDWIF